MSASGQKASLYCFAVKGIIEGRQLAQNRLLDDADEGLFCGLLW